MCASSDGHKDTAIALAEKGADLNIQDTVSDSYVDIHNHEYYYNDIMVAMLKLSTLLCTYLCMCLCLYVYLCTSMYFMFFVCKYNCMFDRVILIVIKEFLLILMMFCWHWCCVCMHICVYISTRVSILYVCMLVVFSFIRLTT